MRSNAQLSGGRTPVPDLGPNKLQQALADYDIMVDDLASTKQQLSQHIDISNKLLAENDAIKQQMKVQVEFLTHQIDTISAHRDRLLLLNMGLLTQFKVIKEVFKRCEQDALAQGVDLNEKTASKDDGSTEEQKLALENLALDDPSRRVHHLPPVRW